MKRYLGVDIGSLFLSAAVVDKTGRPLVQHYVRHSGDIMKCLGELLSGMDLAGVANSAVTGTAASFADGFGEEVNTVVAQVEGAKACFPSVRNIIYIGAGSFSLIRLAEDGSYLKHAMNSVCASGTGAFLDQQAGRLGLTPEKLSELAASHKADPPSVATRCAVFAKTDMIHLQQAGHSTQAICSGLCRSLGCSTVDSLLDGQSIHGETVVIGGVAHNRCVTEAVKAKLGVKVLVPEHPGSVGALGAAILAMKSGASAAFSQSAVKKSSASSRPKELRPPLKLELSRYPEFKFAHFFVDADQTEVTVPVKLQKGSSFRVSFGIDIGSTSTKAVLLSPDGKVVCAFYRKTAGKPIDAVQKILKAVSDAEKMFEVKFDVASVGTTGSGRKMIKAVIGADLEINEITAHAKAAVFIDPTVDTIIELGGQDAKFTQLQDGVVYNSVMNYVCAAGTGSFIEEQAKKLDVSVWDYADFVWGSRAPMTSDRCTVYMERDLDILLAEGLEKRQVAAAVLHSVRDNYLNKVVSGLKIGDRVYFQGATARNKALVAAFEQQLKKPIIVSEFCHLTGALGAALAASEMAPAKTSFKGMSLAHKKFTLDSELCLLCANKCNMSLIKSDSDVIAWGLKCGREYSERKRKAKDVSGMRAMRERQKALDRVSVDQGHSKGPRGTVGVPMALAAFGYLPMWKAFFGALGIEAVISGASSEATFKKGMQHVTAEFCAPVIMAHGHAADMYSRNVDAVFLPHMVREKKNPLTTESHFCCYVQAFPSVMASVARQSLESKVKGPVWARPVIQFSKGEDYNSRQLHESLKGVFGVSLKEVKEAFHKAVKEQERFDKEVKSIGTASLRELAGNKQMGIVLIGRPYNIYDRMMNLDLPEKIAEKGVAVLAQEMLPNDPLSDPIFKEEHPNMYWRYGQNILSAAHFVADSPNLFAIFFTSFSCGPDSYILTYFKDIMARKNKPYLILQFDGHGADAGYLTRVEAAIDSFREFMSGKVRPPKERQQPHHHAHRLPGREELKSRTIFIPPMEPLGARLTAAVFRGDGLDAEVLPENDKTLAIGYRHVSGGECVPCPTTLGSLIHVMQEEKLLPEKTAFFMPTACGPCRFGQYVKLDEMVLKEKGWGGVKILSPSAHNAYEGLAGNVRKSIFDALVASDVMRKMSMRVRPYELEKGRTDEILERSAKAMEKDLEAGKSVDKTLAKAASEFHAVKMTKDEKPRIGIVGEIYVRNSPFINQNLASWVESLGGEAMMPSLGEWVLYTAYLRKRKAHSVEEGFLDHIAGIFKDAYLHRRERALYAIADKVIADRREPSIDEIITEGERYIPIEFHGEAILTLGRAALFVKNDRAHAIVNASPVFCMPGTITSAIFPEFEREFGVPVICNFYDGSGQQNNVLVPHMHFIKESIKEKSSARKAGGHQID